jgi:hypothetical protein
MPTPADVWIFRVTPTVISVLDYSKGFGHTDLVTAAKRCGAYVANSSTGPGLRERRSPVY